MKVRPLLLLVTWLCLVRDTGASASPALYDVQPGVTVVGWDRLSADHQATLQNILDASPRGLAPWLRVITVNDAPIPAPLSDEVCAPNGEFLSRRPCGFNMFSTGDAMENPFPADAPESQSVRLYTAVIVHEYGHQIGQGTTVEQPWVDSLIAEAGSDPAHYLRSMIPAKYFQQNPQEFIASMWGQWGTCSRCVLRLALARWDQGNPHPLNQVILLLALSGFRHGLLNDDSVGTVFAHHIEHDVPVAEFWAVRPYHCDAQHTISGPAFRVTLITDARCRVVSVMEREGL